MRCTLCQDARSISLTVWPQAAKRSWLSVIYIRHTTASSLLPAGAAARCSAGKARTPVCGCTWTTAWMHNTCGAKNAPQRTAESCCHDAAWREQGSQPNAGRRHRVAASMDLFSDAVWMLQGHNILPVRLCLRKELGPRSTHRSNGCGSPQTNIFSRF
jgi:hypothetical protein